MSPSWRCRHSAGLPDIVVLYASMIVVLHGEVATAVVRCYCNDAQCISTGYICKSDIGVCYTAFAAPSGDDVTDHNRWSSAPRGCVDFLPTSPGNDAVTWKCRGAPDDVATASSSLSARDSMADLRHPVADLVCCQHDLCNYADHGARPAGGGLKDNARGGAGKDNLSKLDELPSLDDVNGLPVWNTPPLPVIVDSSLSTTEAWFRAAIIAVPLTGLVLLGVLVIIAARMLHNDATKRRRPELPTSGLTSPIGSLDIWRQQHDHRQPFRSACRCSDVISGSGGGGGDCAGANRYEKMSSSESVVSGGLTSHAFVSDHVIEDRTTPDGRLLNYSVVADDVVCTFSDDPSVSLV